MTAPVHGRNHGGNLLAASSRYNWPPDKFLDFSTNVNPLGPPAVVGDVLRSSLSLVDHYPDPDCLELRAALAEALQVRLESLVAGNGATDLIYLLMRTMHPRRTVIPVPTFSEYERASRASGVPVVHMQLSSGCSTPEMPFRNFFLRLDHLDKILTAGDLLFLCNPNNPTGELFEPGLVDRILDLAVQRGAMVAVDESFLDFVPGPLAESTARLAACSRSVITLVSMTKFYAIPGLRLGYLVAHPDMARLLALAQEPWPVNALALAIGRALPGERQYQEETRRYLAATRPGFRVRLEEEAGLFAYPSEVNYILAGIPGHLGTADRLEEKLGQQGILIRNCSNFPGLDHRYIRLAVKDEESNDRLLAALLRL